MVETATHPDLSGAQATTRLSTTSVTPGAAHAVLLTMSSSPHELTSPLSVTLPPSIAIEMLSASTAAFRFRAALIFSRASEALTVGLIEMLLMTPRTPLIAARGGGMGHATATRRDYQPSTIA